MYILKKNVILITIIVAPLFVLEFLHRVVDIFEDYFGECNETIIKEHYVIIYEVYMQIHNTLRHFER